MKNIFLLISMFLFLIFSSCATYKTQIVETKPIQEYKNKQTIGNITIVVEPFDTSQKIKSAFYIDTSQKNIYPIQIIVENNGKDEIVWEKDKIKLIYKEGDVYKPVNSQYVVNKFKHDEIAYALLGFGIWSYMSAQQANEKMRADWQEKELPEEKIILPDKKISGFVFFETKKHLSGCKIEIEIKNLKTSEKFLFSIPIGQ